MGPDTPLPYNQSRFKNTDSYVDSLLNLLCTKDLLRILCGGVHLLDLFTSDEDIYSCILPPEWRDFFQQHEMMDLLDLFMREDLEQFTQRGGSDGRWRGGPLPPKSLLEYLEEVRMHLLDRSVTSSRCRQNRTQKKLARQVTIGMNVKKVHEVGLYSAYVDELATSLHSAGHNITHLVDFGSGQNYLGRALASEPYNRDIVAIESKSRNSERAKGYDVRARLVEKHRIIRNKKAHRAGLEEPALETAPPRSMDATQKYPVIKREAIQYVDHRIVDGSLSDVIARIPDEKGEKSIMIMSLHSCGNLVHHALRSLILNREVRAVALVGCCYNLLTERLGPATYKLPELRPNAHLHPRLRTATNGHDSEHDDRDPNGFPMSTRFCKLDVRLNITARMMAVQAPQNWGPKDSEAFFTRHFYRALLQRVFIDCGVVGPPSAEHAGRSPSGHSSPDMAITIGSLRKSCYVNFATYVRGAMDKIMAHDAPNLALGAIVKEKMSQITDTELEAYEKKYWPRKKDLSVTWSLMAFSAGVVEAAILVDRWLWLQEQEEVEEAWVEGVFEYGMSPRNMALVGVKKG